jgi:hypothetical protein
MKGHRDVAVSLIAGPSIRYTPTSSAHFVRFSSLPNFNQNPSVDFMAADLPPASFCSLKCLDQLLAST